MITTTKNWARLLVSAVAALGAGGLASAQTTCPATNACPGCSFTVTEMGMSGPEFPGNNFMDVTLLGFDQTLGDLKSVQLTATIVSSDQRFRIENCDDHNACAGSQAPDAFRQKIDVTLFEPSAAPAWCTKLDFANFQGPIPMLAANTELPLNCKDLTGPASFTATQAPVMVNCAPFCIENATRLNSFKRINNPGGMVTFDILFAGLLQQQESGCPNVRSGFDLRIKVTITAVYTYCKFPPTANNDSGEVCENRAGVTPKTFVDLPLLANDCATAPGALIDCTSLTIVPGMGPTKGALVAMNCAGTGADNNCTAPHNNCAGCVFRYTPNDGASGTDTFKYTVKDNGNGVPANACGSNQATVTVTILASPNAVNDTRDMCKATNAFIDIAVISNDTAAVTNPVNQQEIVCNSLAIIGAATPAGATAVKMNCSGNGPPCASCVVRYTPPAGFSGCGGFTYEITDEKGCKDTATVTVRVFNPPTANPDSAQTCEGVPKTIGILDNDAPGAAITGCSPPPGVNALDCTSVIAMSPTTQGGTVQVNQACGGVANGACVANCVVYTPPAGFVGVDTFTYTVKDTKGCVSAPATVTITIVCGPLAVDDVVDKDPDSSAEIIIPVLANDACSDPNCSQPCSPCTFKPGSLMLIAPFATRGTATVFTDIDNIQKIRYQPNTPFNGPDRFCYKVENSCNCPAQACVTVKEPELCEMRNRRQCASLLLYPEFDNREGVETLVTLTMGCCEYPVTGTTVEFRFIRKLQFEQFETCSEANQSFDLTPCDTVTFLTRNINSGGNGQRGYMYAYARNNTPSPGNQFGTPIVFNRLIGNEIILDGYQVLNYSFNAVAFRGIGTTNEQQPAPDGTLNDDDGDGIRDLNGPHDLLPEYEEAPDRILIPRFLGQTPRSKGGQYYKSRLILIALSGGPAFRTTIDVTGFNDNEDLQSSMYDFTCWAKPLLRTVAPFTDEDYLQSLATNDLDEINLDGIFPHDDKQAGWFAIDGNVAVSTQEEITDPAVYAVLIEIFGTCSASDLPWEECTQVNGDLLPTGIYGDGPNPEPGDNE